MASIFDALMGSITGAPIQSEISDLLQTGNLAQEYGFGTFMPMAQQDYGQVQKYLSGILSGDPTKVMQTLSPEISALQQQMQQAKKNISEFTPQGGGQTAQLSEAPFKTSGDITNLISQARSGAAGALGGLAGQLTGEATDLGSLSEQSFADAIQGLLGKQEQATGGQIAGAKLGMTAAGMGSFA
jgi:hypothetical protein